jgi:predicted RecB family nuclease
MYAMACRITDDVINALQHCRLKAYFRLRGEGGAPCGYEKLLIEQRANARRKAIEKIRREYSETEVATGLNLSLANLRKGAAFILSALLDDDRHAVVFDALRKTDGPSSLGDFQYQPVIFCAAGRVRASDRQQLAARAVLLARVQGALPGGGVVYLGRDSARTGIRFGPTLMAAENLLRDAERLQRAEGPPKLLLNDHCRICEFRDRCRDQAIRDDDLSLLRGVGEKAIKRYARKGVLTLTQLAHTFRPRRRGKRSDAPLRLRDHALHALAIRDQTIYVLGAPKLPTAPVRIYLDIEGDPEEGFTYLIGLVVCDGERVERHSLWSDDRKGEAEIFARFLAIVAGYDAPRLYCYGDYERSFIARMRRQARRKKSIDAVLSALTNVLTIIYPHFYFPTYSNGLKEVAGCLGCRWTDPDASGIESVVWRKNWEKTGDASWKARLIQYNLARLRLRPTRRVYCYHIAEDLARLATLVNDGQMQARLVELAQSSLHGHRHSKATTVSAECCRAIESRQTRQQVAEGLVHRSTLVHTTAPCCDQSSLRSMSMGSSASTLGVTLGPWRRSSMCSWSASTNPMPPKPCRSV